MISLSQVTFYIFYYTRGRSHRSQESHENSIDNADREIED